MSISTNPPLILASSSIYRRELLERLRIPFKIISPQVDEVPLAGESTLNLALRLAHAKAAAVAKQHPNAWIIGSDQVADLCGAAIGKPGNFERALAQLQMMRGQTVTFHTALCLMSGDTESTISVPTEVVFRNLSDDILESYLLAEEPYDCAGSAKSEGLGISLIESIKSDDPTALIGLPLIALSGLLRDAGFTIPSNGKK
jgi:septum formation protein